jgi:LacI family transcriptional regulator
MKDIARETGLGLATISKYLNGGRVREENRAALEAAIKKLDYHVNEYARGLKSNRTKTIGVIIPELSNLFITTILSRMEEVLRESGYSMIVCDCHTSGKLECQAVTFLMGKMVDGLVNMPVCTDGRHLRPAEARQLPIVLLDNPLPEAACRADAVYLNNSEASHRAADFLLGRGHTAIGIIAGPDKSFTAEQRLAGYVSALAERGIAVRNDLIARCDYTVPGGYQAMKKLLAARPGMTAVFMTNYEVSLGSIMAIREAGLSIPGNLSVIGFDDMALSRLVSPPLAVVAQPLYEMGTQAAQLLLRRIAVKNVCEPQRVMLGASFSEGESVACVHS